MGPGPSNVNPRVLKAMTAPLLGHLDPEFLKLMDDIKEMLRLVFQTNNPITFPVSGTGSAGIETAMVNILEAGDTAVVGVNGYFGDRMAQIAERCRANVYRIETEWGQPLDPDKVKAELGKHKNIKLVAMVHAETSTGVLSPVPDIAKITHEHDALMIVDAVTSLGGVEINVDDWGIDVSYSGSQKCLGCPPGLAPLTLGPKAHEVLLSRNTPVQSWYLDVSLLENYWSSTRAYHHTAPISMIYGLREGLRVVLEEGLEARYQRHTRNAKTLREGLKSLGIELFAQESAQLDTLISAWVPNGMNDATLRKALLNDHNIEIGGGLGQFSGKIWRIGLMGENSNSTAVLTFLSALESVLSKEGYKVPRN